MKDFILTQTFTKLFLVGAVLAAIFYGVFGGIGAAGPQIVKLTQDLKAAKEKYKVTQERTADKAKFQEDVENMSQTFRLALDYLPKELDTPDLIRKISSEARSSGVRLSKFKPKPPVSKDFYDELQMEVELKGTYPQVVLFLAYIAKIPRIINIKNIELGDPQVADNGMMVKLRGVLVAYRYKEGK